MFGVREHARHLRLRRAAGAPRAAVDARARTARTSTRSPTRSATRWSQAGIGFGDAIERVVADRGELTFHVRREHLPEVAGQVP